MVTPLLDERMMIRMLQTAVTPDGIHPLRGGATAVILNAFDRKLTRDEFIVALGSAVELIDMMGRLALIDSVREFMVRHDGCATVLDADAARQQIIETATRLAAECVAITERVRQCPLDEDKVH